MIEQIRQSVCCWLCGYEIKAMLTIIFLLALSACGLPAQKQITHAERAEREAMRIAGHDRCSVRQTLASPGTSERVEIAAVNFTEETIFFQWIDFSGNLDDRPGAKSEISIGESYRQRSYIDHIFIVTNAAKHCIGIWTAQEIASLKSVRSKPTSGASPKASDDYELFIGDWCGFWNRGVYHSRLRVTSMNKEGGVRGVYSFGRRRWEFDGKITDGKLEFKLRGGERLRYWFKEDGTLFGTYEGRSTIDANPC